MTGVLIRREHLGIDADMHTGQRPYEDKGKDWVDALTSQGMLKISNKLPEAKREAFN